MAVRFLEERAIEGHMNILPDSRLRLFVHDLEKAARANTASRRDELQALKGVGYAVRRMRIEVWAWRKALREVKRHGGI
jgi:hypothetical protein